MIIWIQLIATLIKGMFKENCNLISNYRFLRFLAHLAFIKLLKLALWRYDNLMPRALFVKEFSKLKVTKKNKTNQMHKSANIQLLI